MRVSVPSSGKNRHYFQRVNSLLVSTLPGFPFFFYSSIASFRFLSVIFFCLRSFAFFYVSSEVIFFRWWLYFGGILLLFFLLVCLIRCGIFYSRKGILSLVFYFILKEEQGMMEHRHFFLNIINICFNITFTVIILFLF